MSAQLGRKEIRRYIRVAIAPTADSADGPLNGKAWAQRGRAAKEKVDEEDQTE
jgi:hypothetical protein